jgi:hypothetical protein
LVFDEKLKVSLVGFEGANPLDDRAAEVFQNKTGLLWVFEKRVIRFFILSIFSRQS